MHIIWHNGGRRNASNCTDLYVTIQNFRKVALAPPHIGEGIQRPSPNHTPQHSSAARLPHLARCLNRPPMFVSRRRHYNTPTTRPDWSVIGVYWWYLWRITRLSWAAVSQVDRLRDIHCSSTHSKIIYQDDFTHRNLPLQMWYSSHWPLMIQTNDRFQTEITNVSIPRSNIRLSADSHYISSRCVLMIANYTLACRLPVCVLACNCTLDEGSR